jgi:hypothetical protein
MAVTKVEDRTDMTASSGSATLGFKEILDSCMNPILAM